MDSGSRHALRNLSECMTVRILQEYSVNSNLINPRFRLRHPTSAVCCLLLCMAPVNSASELSASALLFFAEPHTTKSEACKALIAQLCGIMQRRSMLPWVLLECLAFKTRVSFFVSILCIDVSLESCWEAYSLSIERSCCCDWFRCLLSPD